MSTPSPFRSRPFRTAAVVLLLVAAFGGLSVGVPLVIAILTTPARIERGTLPLLVPGGFLAYGLLSLGGAIGLLAGWRRTIVMVVLTQGFVAIGLLWVYLAQAADVSLLIVGGIAAAAGLCALADRLVAGPG